MLSMLWRYRAAAEALPTLWSLALSRSRYRPASPHHTIEAHGLQLRPSHRWPAATGSQNRVFPEGSIERSNALFFAHPPKEAFVAAVRQSGIAVQLPDWRDQSSTCRSPAEIGETHVANCRYPQPCGSKRAWQASAHTHPHQIPSTVRRFSLHAATGQRIQLRSQDLGPASFPKHHCGLVDTGGIHLSEAAVPVTDDDRATVGVTYPLPSTHTPMVQCITGRISAALSDSAALEPGTSVRLRETLHSSRRQLFVFSKVVIAAIRYESPDPLKVYRDCPCRDMALAPKLDNGSLSIISERHLRIHERSDVSMMKGVERLSRGA
jgi:hypothetical protein